MSGPPGPQRTDPFSQNVPPRTPGPLGHNDAGDPNAYADLGATPGPLGVNDHATPQAGRPVHSPARGSILIADASPDAKPAVDGWPTTLSWPQFSEIPSHPAGVTEDAQTGTQQPAIPEITVEHNKKGFHLGKFTVSVSLDTDKCWVVKGRASAPLLKHEQVHWDIAGLGAYEVSRKLHSLSTTKRGALNEAVQSAMQRLAIKAQALQFWYDDESKHGLEPKGQKKWEELVSKAISDHYGDLPTPPKQYLEQARKELGL